LTSQPRETHSAENPAAHPISPYANSSSLLPEGKWPSCIPGVRTPSPQVIPQTLLGHANVTITLDTYSHVLPLLHEEAAEKVAGLILRAR
jgi:hypothetical protein